MQSKKLDEIRTDYLRDIKNLCPQAFITTDSDNYVRASATASAVEGNYQYADYVLKQSFTTTSDAEYLEIEAGIYDIYRKQATAASGTARFTGEVGAVIEVGTLLEFNEISYITNETVLINEAGEAVAHVVCQSLGTLGNLTEAALAQLSSAPQGVDNVATIQTMEGGTNVESTDSLRERILDRKRRPAAGGNAHDYYVWAMSVAGVHKAFIYPLRRGLGTVDIVILGENGLPSNETINKCQAFIDSVRPVTAKDSVVIEPDVVDIDFIVRIKLDGSVVKERVEESVKTVIRGYFADFAPAQSYVKSQLETLISHIAGVYDRTIVLPADNVESVVDEDQVQWLQAGAIEVVFE